MAQKLNLDALTRPYWWPVDVRQPDTEKAGEFTTSTFEAQFVALSEEEMRRIAGEIADQPTERLRAARQHDLLLSAVVAWRDIEDGDGKPVPFSAATLHKVVYSNTWVREALYNAYRASLNPPAQIGA